MLFQILNVGHGSCAYFVADNGNVMLFDCGLGHLRPSTHLPATGCTGVEYFFVTNFDEDHISDLPALRATGLIGSRTQFFRNQSISVEQLRRLKLQGGPISAAMEQLLEMHGSYVHHVAPADDPPFSNTRWSGFRNTYPEMDDTNNLSYVVFLESHDLRVVLPGDLEAKGWGKLLESAAFRAELSRVNVFVASHHGRESGYYEPVFGYCKPELVVVSDGPKQYLTQEMVNTYAGHALGAVVGGTRRKVLTTRADGTISFRQNMGGGLTCHTG